MDDTILAQFCVTREDARPIYQQLQTQLETMIASGTWEQHEPLPSETALAAQLDISVMTVRQAMTGLVNKGLITREKGRGTFVVPQPVSLRPTRLDGFSADMRARAMRPSARILAFEVIIPPPKVAAHLALRSNQSVLYIRRLRLVEDLPIVVQAAYITYTALTRAELDTTGSLYKLLETKGIYLSEADETVKAVNADHDIAHLLQVEPGAALMRIDRTTWDTDDNPVEYVMALCRGDSYDYSVHLTR